MPDTAVDTSAQPTFTELRGMMDGTATPAPAEPTKPAETKTPAEATPETDPATRTDPASEPDKTKQEPARDEKGKYTPNAEKRIAQLTAKQREAERERDELRTKLARYETPADGKPAVSAERPKLDDFVNDGKFKSYDEAQDAYGDALADWKLRERDRAAAAEADQRAGQAREEAWKERSVAAREKYSDYDAVLQNAPDVELNGLVMQAIADSDLGHDLLYHLSKNPADAERLSKLSPTAAVKEIGRLEDKLAETKAPETPKQPKVTSAPKPPATVAAGAAPHTPDPKDLDKADMRTFKQQYDSLLKR